MENQDIRIRAKKISELQNFDLTPDENSFIIIGYNNGEVKQNYKMNLVDFISLISTSDIPGGAIDDATLIAKINQFISSEQIILPSISGPQGPQGPQGATGSGEIDLENIQSQIDHLQEIINRYHKSYSITYNLSNINSISSNPISVGYDKSVTLYFIPSNGYVMPNNIDIDNCQYNYDKENKSIFIYNPTGNVTVNIIGERGFYTLSKVFNNINVEVIGNELQTYPMDGTITYKLTPASNSFRLPESINFINCTVQYTPNNDYTSAFLTVTCNGAGNMSISASAISNVTYYFGIISIDNSTKNKIEITWEYDSDNIIANILDVNVKNTNWMTSNTSCPFQFNSNIILSENVKSGVETVMIVPEEFYDPLTYLFTNGVNSGKLYFGSSPFPFESDIYKRITIDNVAYYCVSLQDGLNSGNKVIIK